MTPEIIHVVPGRSAAGTVREALRTLGLREKVVAIADHLGYGPIDGDLDARRAWLEDILGQGSGEVVDRSESMWSEVLKPHVFPVIWTCRADAGDFAGFLDFLSRIDDRPFQCIDATGVRVEGNVNRWAIPRLGVVSEEQMIAADLFSCRAELSMELVGLHRDVWRRLKEENAELRVVEGEELRSKLISHFDSRLLDQVPPAWTLGVRVVGHALADLISTGNLIDDRFIWARYCALADEGALEMEAVEGPDEGMRGFRVRTPPRPQKTAVL